MAPCCKDLNTIPEAEGNVAWPAYSPDMSSTEHVWDALDQRALYRVPVPANMQQHSTGHSQQPDQI